MGKGNRTRQIASILILIFIIGMAFTYQYTYTPSYSSLKEAVEKSSNGGKIATSFDFDKGSFVFIKNSAKKYDYYYLKEKKWYNKGIIYTKKYEIENQYTVTVYYVQRNKLSFIKVESKEELGNLYDSLDTTFQELKISKNNKFFFGGTYKQLPDEYRITINDQEYWLKEYNSLFKLFT